MKIAHSKNRASVAPVAKIAKALREVSPQGIRALVEALAFPRHYTRDRRANRKARDLILKHARSLGDAPALHGRYDNILLSAGAAAGEACILLGAHYDSVPGTPGADDNASAVAVCLECARVIRNHQLGPAMIVL